MSLEIGAVFPTSDIGNDPIAIRDFAQTAEALGYSHLITYDHVIGAPHEGREPPLQGPYTEADAFHEPMVLFGYLAGLTQRIEFLTGILILPQRQTVLVAKQAAELAVLSGGRFALGAGTGWNWVEYEALNQDYASRGRRLDEQVELLRRLWSEPVVQFDGDFHSLQRAGLLPLPEKPIPIWFGGFSPPAIRRAARIGDGFLFGATSKGMRRLCEKLFEKLDETGRREGFGIDAVAHYGEGPEAWRAEAEAWAKLGATRFSMTALDQATRLTGQKPAGLRTPGEHIAALEPFMEAVRGI